jgi:hypothetical protein
MKFFAFISVLLFTTFSTKCGKEQTSMKIIAVKDGSKEFRATMITSRDHSMMKIVIRENTLNDTAMFGGNMKIPPGRTGTFFQGDCYMDSFPFIYQPYKATKGRLIIAYSSF